MWKTTHHRLEAGVDLGQEGRLQGKCQYPLLYHGALHIIILYDDVLLEYLYCIQLICPLPLSQHYLLKHHRIHHLPELSNTLPNDPLPSTIR